MEKSYAFYPPRARGYIVLSSLALANLLLVVWLFQQASSSEFSSYFMLYLLVTLLAIIPLPVLIIQIYNLRRSLYFIERDGLRLQWGGRIEDISLPDVLWVRETDSLQVELRSPILSLPGAVVGRRQHPDLGEVEFMASRRSHLLLVGAAERVYAISPSDPHAFLNAYRELTELGSLAPIIPQSIYPAFVITELMEDRWSRILLLAAFVLNLGLIILVSISVPAHPQIALGYTPADETVNLLPGVQLFLLPAMSVFYWIANFILSMVLIQRADRRPLAYVLLIVGNISTALLILAVVLIVA